MTQEILDRLIGAAPPSTVDLDAVIARSRRKQRVRRAAVSGSAGVAVVAAVLAGLTLGGGTPTPRTAAAVPSPVPSASPSETRAATSPMYPLYSLRNESRAGQAESLRHLRERLELALKGQAPTAKWIYMPDVPGEKRTPDGHPVMSLGKDPITYEARSGITLDGVKGGLYVSIRPVGSPSHDCDDIGPKCTTTVLNNGRKVVEYVDEPGQGWVFYGAEVVLSGEKHSLRMLAVNYFGGDGSPAVAPAPVLTQEQLRIMTLSVAGNFSE